MDISFISLKYISEWYGVFILFWVGIPSSILFMRFRGSVFVNLILYVLSVFFYRVSRVVNYLKLGLF